MNEVQHTVTHAYTTQYSTPVSQPMVCRDRSAAPELNLHGFIYFFTINFIILYSFKNENHHFYHSEQLQSAIQALTC